MFAVARDAAEPVTGGADLTFTAQFAEGLEQFTERREAVHVDSLGMSFVDPVGTVPTRKSFVGVSLMAVTEDVRASVVRVPPSSGPLARMKTREPYGYRGRSVRC